MSKRIPFSWIGLLTGAALIGGWDIAIARTVVDRPLDLAARVAVGAVIGCVSGGLATRWMERLTRGRRHPE